MLEIKAAGVQTSLQDAGRPGHRHLGVPCSGAADKLSFALANWMVGNSWSAPALECALGGLHVKFHDDTTIAIAGAEMNASLRGKPMKNFSYADVRAGDELVFKPSTKGSRAYLAVAGGLSGTSFLESVATYTLAKLGGIDGSLLATGDKIKYGDEVTEAPRALPAGFAPVLSNHIVLRVRPGPEVQHLKDTSKRELFIRPFTATRATDRMGSRLDGVKIEGEYSKSYTSSPILPGTLQIPPDNRPILALIDGHCTGGYLRAAQVIRADIWQLGQIAPGTKISFHRCFDEDAPKILTQRNATYSHLIDGFSF